MNVEAALRLAWSLVAVIGLAGLAWSLGSQVGAWAAFLLFLVVGGVVAVPMWRRYLEDQAIARMQQPPELPQRRDDTPQY